MSQQQSRQQTAIKFKKKMATTLLSNVISAASEIHKQIESKKRKAQNKPLTWRNKEVKSKYHNREIMALIDLEDMCEIREWKKRWQKEQC